jgi:hypothetical protein
MMRRSFRPLVCGLLLCVSGCRSIGSTFVQRMDDDRLVGNSNGKTGLHDNAKPFKGIPVTIPVLTHVDISIIEETKSHGGGYRSLQRQDLRRRPEKSCFGPKRVQV